MVTYYQNYIHDTFVKIYSWNDFSLLYHRDENFFKNFSRAQDIIWYRDILFLFSSILIRDTKRDGYLTTTYKR